MNYNENGERKGVNSRTAKIVLFSLMICAAVAYIFFASDSWNTILNTQKTEQKENFVETDFRLSYPPQSSPFFYSSDAAKGFFYGTKDGIKFLNDTGEVLWSHTYNFNSPQASSDGRFVAISEQKSGSIFVYDERGLVYEQSAKNPIVSFSAANSGESCVITQKEDGYLVQAFNAGGKLIHEISHSARNVYPVLSAISADGRILAVLFYDVSGVAPRSQITFYYLNKKESMDFPDSIFGVSDDFADEIIFALKFLNGNKLAVISDKTISCIDAASKCVKIWSAESPNKIDAYFFAPDFFAVAYGDELVNKNSLPVGTVKIYKADMVNSALSLDEDTTFDGEVTITDDSYGGRVTYLSGSEKQIIVGRGRKFAAYSPKGVELWTYTPAADIRAVLPISSTKILTISESYSAILTK